MKKNLRIGINAQILPGSGTGGIETVLRVLTELGQLDSGEEYVFIGHWSGADWLKPLLGARQTVVLAAPPVQSKPNRIETFKRLTGSLRPLAREVLRLVVPPPKMKISVPISDGFYESLNCDVIHFPYQDFVRCQVPTVYNPHDLQHLHFPKFFAKAEIERREIVYPWACRAAHTVVVASQFIKQDIIERYKIHHEKVQVIAWSPPEIAAREFTKQDAEDLFEKYKISRCEFALYPAMTWEHKNHIRLLEAVALLRDRDGLKINVVCTGHKNDFFPNIERRLNELKLGEQVKFIGVVSYAELGILYGLAQFVVIPTLFEAASAPLFEAWQHNAAAACSAVTSLPEQAADAALLFDPLSIEAIARALKTMTIDENLRADLRARGRRRLQYFDREQTLKSYRAVYRKAAGGDLNHEDRDLLNSN